MLWAHAVRAQHCARDYGLGPRPAPSLDRLLDFYLLLPVQVEEDEDEGREHPEDHEDTDDERADQLVFAEKRRTCEKKASFIKGGAVAEWSKALLQRDLMNDN